MTEKDHLLKRKKTVRLPGHNFGSQKRDWGSIFIEYMGAEEVTVGQFLENHLGMTKREVGLACKQIAGWREKKEKELLRANRRAMDNLRKERIDLEMTKARKLAKSHDSLLEFVNANIVYWQENNFKRRKDGKLKVTSPIDTMALERMVKLVRTELGEPESLSTILLGGAQEHKKAPDLTKEEIDALESFISRQLPKVETQIDAPTG